jgi:hypothetical protein
VTPAQAKQDNSRTIITIVRLLSFVLALLVG